jgi:hypothetical protein
VSGKIRVDGLLAYTFSALTDNKGAGEGEHPQLWLDL